MIFFFLEFACHHILTEDLMSTGSAIDIFYAEICNGSSAFGV